VPTNTPLLATYEIGATHNAEEVIVTLQGEQPQVLAASYSPAVRTLTARLPEGSLRPNADYTVAWPGLLTSSDDPARGKGASISFSVGAGPDMSRPSFSGASEVRWDSERYLFDLRLPEPSYAGGIDLLTVVAFQTQGPRLERDANGNPSPQPVYTQRYAGDEWITIKRSVADGVGRVCFSAIVQAPSGLISDSTQEEVCTTTVRPPFFDGCSLRAPGDVPAERAWLLLLALAGVLLGLRQQGARRTSRESR
jgi:hypothetical protein